jgi:DNA-binding NarL/FixJ family response regulator
MARILIVDDSSIARRNLSNIFTDAGHTVVAEAPNGELAFKEYERHEPDIVTMDISMPMLDGIGAVKKIIKKYPDANIVMISALDQKHMVLSAIQCGAKHYIIKPFTAAKVLSVIDEVLLLREKAASAASAAASEPSEHTDNASSAVEYADSDALPFKVENKAGELHITLRKNIPADSFNSLDMIVQGFLFINPLKIHLDLQDADHIEGDVIDRIVELAKLAENYSAPFKLSAAKAELLEYIKTKNNYLSNIVE